MLYNQALYLDKHALCIASEISSYLDSCEENFARRFDILKSCRVDNEADIDCLLTSVEWRSR